MVKQKIADFKKENDLRRAMMPPPSFIIPKNFRTVPCRNYHGPAGCARGETCHFIHALGYEQREIPREVFIKYRNEHMCKNHLDEIALKDPMAAM